MSLQLCTEKVAITSQDIKPVNIFHIVNIARTFYFKIFG